MIRRPAARFLTIAVSLVAIALLSEFALEARDTARYTPGQTFAKVGEARIRYRLVGAGQPGAPVVILSGVGGSIEQTDQLQSAVSKEVPSLTYDRAGYGFSQNSSAHSAGGQAEELAGLLAALKIEKPLVLVAYSASNQAARVFASRYPQKVACLYLLDPQLPEIDVGDHRDPRRHLLRWVVHDLVASSLGITRLMQRVHNWQEPSSPVDRRVEAVLARRSHHWALAQEWYATPVSSQQTRDNPIPRTLPLEVAFPTQLPGGEAFERRLSFRADLVASSDHGTLVELGDVKHSSLLAPGPVLDRIIARIEQLSLANAPDRN